MDVKCDVTDAAGRVTPAVPVGGGMALQARASPPASAPKASASASVGSAADGTYVYRDDGEVPASSSSGVAEDALVANDVGVRVAAMDARVGSGAGHAAGDAAAEGVSPDRLAAMRAKLRDKAIERSQREAFEREQHMALTWEQRAASHAAAVGGTALLLRRCPHCRKLMMGPAPAPGESDLELTLHTQACRFLPTELMAAALSAPALTEAQQRALFYVAASARTRSNEALEREGGLSLRARCKRLGFNDDALLGTLRWVRDGAPIIIHVSTSALEEILREGDPHYRSQHETRPMAISTWRDAKEAALFDSAYVGATAFEKPKYGCMNFTNDSNGVASAFPYGMHYLRLKSSLRVHATFANKNTGLSGDLLATCESYAHVLELFTDQELAAALRVGAALDADPRAAPPEASSAGVTSTYKELQVHGAIRIARDVEVLVLKRSAAGRDNAAVDVVKRKWEERGWRVEIVNSSP